MPGLDKHWLSIYRLLSNLLLKIIIYFVTAVTTIQSSILKLCHKFQVLNSHFSEVYDMHNEQWALSKHCMKRNISTPICVQCNNMYWCRELINSGKSCWFILCHLRMTTIQKWYSMQKLGSRLQNMTSHILFFFDRSIQTHSLVVKASCSESGFTGLITSRCRRALQSLSHFAWHWACQCTDM